MEIRQETAPTILGGEKRNQLKEKQDLAGNKSTAGPRKSREGYQHQSRATSLKRAREKEKAQGRG